MRKLRVLVLLCLLCLLAAPALAEKTTVMVYMCGSNLESLYGSASADMQEMLVSGFDPQEVNLVVMAGGSTAWQDSTFTQDRLTIAVAQPRKRGSGLRFTAVETLPNASMGESDTLLAFLSYARNSYPADRYALVLWDHGGGPLHGVCWDELYDADSLSLQEVTSALERAGLGGEDKLYFIGFDACLMGSVEVASAMAPYAECMIASEETEPGLGWNYAFLGDIAADATAADTGRHIVDGYFSAQQGTASVLTMACYDLSAVSEVSRAAQAFFGALGNVDTENYIIHAEARRAARGYGRAYGAGGDYDLVDLQGMLAAGCYADTEGADELRAALNDMVLYSRSNVEGSGGVSIFYPYYEPEKFAQDNSAYAAYTVSEAYLRYLTDFVSVQLGNILADWTGLVIVSDEAQDNFTLALTPAQAENTVKAELLVLYAHVNEDGICYSLVSRTDAGMPDENHVLHARNPRTMLVNGADHRLIPYTQTDDERYRVRIQTYGDFTSFGVLEMMDDGDESLTITDYFMHDPETDALTNRHSFDLLGQDEWVISCPIYIPVRDENGVMRGFDQWQRSEHPRVYTSKNADSMRFRFEEMRDENWRLFAVWQLTDTQGNTWSSDIVELNNPGNRTESLIPQENDGPLQITGGWVTAYVGDGVSVTIELTNTGDHTLQIDDPNYYTVLSGCYVDVRLLPSHTVTLEPGQTMIAYQEYKSEQLYRITEISSVGVQPRVVDEEAAVTDHVFLSAALEEPLSLEPWIEVPKMPQPVGEGEKDDVKVTVFSAQLLSDGGLKLELMVDNGSDEPLDFDTYHAGLMINGNPLRGMGWYLLESDGSKDSFLTFQPHSARYACIILGGSSQYGGPVYKIGQNDLAGIGVEAIHSISMFGVDVEMQESIPVTEAHGKKLLLYGMYHGEMLVDEMRVEPLQDREGLWSVGLHVTAANRSGFAWLPEVYEWYINGKHAEKYERGNGHLLIDTDESVTTWLYFITDQLPEEGVSSIGMTFYQQNFDMRKYWPVTVTASTDIPLNGSDRLFVYADDMHTDLSVYDVELVDEPAWQQVNFEGILQVGETELRAEIMDASITENAHLTGWLRLTNDTDQRVLSCAILYMMHVNQSQQIADFLVIDAAIDAHAVTWQRIDIPLYANRQLVNDELDAAQQILGFGPEGLGLEAISEIGSASSAKSYMCRMKLSAVEPLPVPHTEQAAGQTVLETANGRIELLAARTVATDNGTQVYTMLRGINPNETNVFLEAGAPDKLGDHRFLSLSGLSGIYLFSWNTDSPADEVQAQFRLNDDVSDIITLRADGGLCGETAWVPALRAESGAAKFNGELEWTLSGEAPFRVTDVQLEKRDDAIRLRVDLENTTDTDCYVTGVMIVLDGIAYKDTNRISLSPQGKDYTTNYFSRDGVGTALLNTPVIHNIRLPLHYSTESSLTSIDIREGVYPYAVLEISCEADASCATEEVNVIGKGGMMLNGEELDIEVISVEQDDTGALNVRCLMNNTTEHVITQFLSLHDMLVIDNVQINTNDVRGMQICALPGTRTQVELKIGNTLIAPYYFFEGKWNSRHPMVADGLKQSGLREFSRIRIRGEGYAMSFSLDAPFVLHAPDSHTAAKLFTREGWTADVLSLSVLNDETNGRGLCLLVKVTNDGGQEGINPGVTSWYVNGERLKPNYVFFPESQGPLNGTSKLMCLFMNIPEGMEEINTLKLFCVLNDIWPNKDDGLAEIVLSEPLPLDHTYSIPGGELTVIPAVF